MLDDLRERYEENAWLVKIVGAVVLASALIAWYLWEPPMRVGPRIGAGSRVLILMHGSGAPKDDLQGLATELTRAAPKLTVLLPAGPHRRGAGRTWYPAFTAETPEAVERRLQELRAEARAIVEEAIVDALDDGVPASNIYVGGFSQGATVALDVAINGERGKTIGGLVSLSGGALDIDLTTLEGRAPLRAFVSHGKADGVLGASASKTLATDLEDTGHDVTWVFFDGAHTIPLEVRDQLGPWLGRE